PQLFARTAYRFRVRHHGGRMGSAGRAAGGVGIRHRAARGPDGGARGARALLPPAGSGDGGDDLLLRRDQPDDGDGAGPGGGYSPALHEPWWIVDADQYDLYRHADGGRPMEPECPSGRTWIKP